MVSKNGIRRATTTVAPTKPVGDVDKGYRTHGLMAAHAAPTPRDENRWRCADAADPDMFQPTTPEALAEAVAFCGGCQVRTQCLALGVERRETGVWGGVLLERGKPMTHVRTPGRPKARVRTDNSQSAA